MHIFAFTIENPNSKNRDFITFDISSDNPQIAPHPQIQFLGLILCIFFAFIIENPNQSKKRDFIAFEISTVNPQIAP